MVRDKKEGQLVELLNDVNTKLQAAMDGEEYSCITTKLSKMGKLTKLNDPKRTKKAVDALYSCVNDMNRVVKIKGEMDKAIQAIEDKKEENKKLKKFK